MEEGGTTFEHTPVLHREVTGWLVPVLAGRTLVDCTLGSGGHTQAILESAGETRVIGIDRDRAALDVAARKLERFGGRVRFQKANFADLDRVLDAFPGEEVGAVLYDLGVWSAHFDDPGRGFGYRADSALDMRMDREDSLTAEEIVNTYSEPALADLIYLNGEERHARRVARAIVRRRERLPITTTGELAEIVRGAIPAAARRRGPHPARRTFQALRIEVNRELEALGRSLPIALERTAPGGRVAVVSYHSLEDRMVKTAFSDAGRGCRCPVDSLRCTCGRAASLRILTPKVVKPSEDEIKSNPRSRSARLRVAMPLESPEVA